MTRRVGNTIIVEEEEPQQCEDCGELKELRPYGPNGTKVCVTCALKDPVSMYREMDKALGLDR